MIKSYMGKSPIIDKDSFIADTASVVGDVSVGKDSSVWYGAVIRGDMAPISIGCGTCIQDNAVCHCEPDAPMEIGNNVTVGHTAILHCSKVSDNVLIGMGAIVLNDAVIGENSIIGAGAVVLEGTVVPPNTLMVGIPAKPVRTLSPEQIADRQKVSNYVAISKQYIKDAE